MPKRQAIVVTLLLLVTAACATVAYRAWRHQQAAALAASRVPAIPDLSHWPAAFSNEVRKATFNARHGIDPAGSLAQLACLYLGNSYVPQSMPPLAALCRLEPSNAKWTYLLADAHMRLGETNAAQAGFQKTTSLDPHYAMAWIRLGLLLTQTGSLTDAHACYVRAANADPTNLMHAFLLMEFEARNGFGGDIRGQLQDFSRAHPDFKDPHELLAVFEDAAGDPAEAQKERRAAATAPLLLPNEDPWLDPLAQFCFDAERLREVSLAAFGEGRIDMAEKMLNRGIQIAPTDPLLRDALCSVYEKQGRQTDALQTLQQAVKDCPEDSNLPMQLSRLLCAMNRPNDAIASITPALQKWPSNAKLHAALGYALSKAGENEQAVAELKEALRLDFTQVEVRYNLAIGLLAIGQRDAARESAQKALEIRPDYTDAMALLGDLALEDKDLASADPMVSRLYVLQPEDPKARALFCDLQLLKGGLAERARNGDEAEKSYTAGLAVNPNDWRLLRADGVLAVNQGHLTDAIERFRGYVKSQPEKTEPYFMLGLVLKKAGQGDEARKVLQQGLDLEARNGNNPSETAAFRHALEQ